MSSHTKTVDVIFKPMQKLQNETFVRSTNFRTITKHRPNPTPAIGNEGKDEGQTMYSLQSVSSLLSPQSFHESQRRIVVTHKPESHANFPGHAANKQNGQ